MTPESHAAPVPASFLALHPAPPRGHDASARQAIADRHEWCEDLAQALVETARAQCHDLGITPGDVLARIGAGLRHLDEPLAHGEAGWVQRRLAELLDWRLPEP